MRVVRVVVGLLIACAGPIAVSCADNSPLDRPAGSEELRAADQVVREYLIAAAADDGRRLCSLRTVRDVRRLGGRAQCQRQLARSAFEGGPEPGAVERGDVKVLPADTHGVNGHIVVWADAGEAYFEGGHATGGTVVMARVYEKDGRRRIGAVGEATFAD
jgi:hypothetical protein